MYRRVASSFLCFLLWILNVRYSKNDDISLLYNKLLCWLQLWLTQTRRYGPYIMHSKNPLKNGIIITDDLYNLERCIPCGELKQRESQEIVVMAQRSSTNEALVIKFSRNSQKQAQIFVRLTTEDGKSYTLAKSEIVPDLSGGMRYHANGLRLHVKVPTRKWRIAYNGMMVSEKNADHGVYVKFVFTFTAQSPVIDWQYDTPKANIIDYCAHTSPLQTFSRLERYKKHFNGYEQNGTLVGTLSIDEGTDKEVYLWGLLCRMRNSYESDVNLLPSIEHFVTFEKHGEVIHLVSSKYQEENDVFQLGSIFSVSNFKDPMSHIDTRKRLIGSEKCDFTVSTFEIEYPVKVTSMIEDKFAGETIFVGYPGSFSVSQCDILSRQRSAKALILSAIPTSHNSTTRKHLWNTSQLELSLTNFPLVVNFHEDICRDSELTGGKGSSLAILSKIAEDHENKFCVPPGVVVTTEAFRKFLETIAYSADHFVKSINGSGSAEEIRKICVEFVEKMQKESLPKSVQTGLRRALKAAFPSDNIDQIQFAVRSSAAGEDTEDMSAAGQMDSYLGVKGLNNIMEAVVKCWASQFSFVAIEYKRRYGQKLVSQMGVVVMKMVDSESAGVLFTCDPKTANPSCIYITANCGLGESVVSALTEPDVIKINRNLNGNMSIDEIVAGRKDVRIVLKDGSTQIERLNEPQLTCSLSSKQAIELAEVSHLIEQIYGDPRDIEWAVFNGKIWLLQSRPVTFRDRANDFEVAHELDIPTPDEQPFLTIHNVGEVMNKALSPLGQDFVCSNIALFSKLVMAKCQRKRRFAVNEVFSDNFVCSQQHVFLDLIQMLRSFIPKTDDPKLVDAMMVNFCGETEKNPEFFQYLQQKYDTSLTANSNQFLSDLNDSVSRWVSRLRLQWYRRILQKVEIDTNDSLDCHHIWWNIAKSLEKLINGTMVHIEHTKCSNYYNHKMIAILKNAHEGFTTKENEIINHDIAVLLSSSHNVLSAEVPQGINHMASIIAMDPTNAEKFAKLDIEEALTFIKSNNSPVAEEFVAFVEKHQHRGYNEFDVYRQPYGMDAKPLVSNIQIMVQSLLEHREQQSKENTSVKECIQKLKTPLNKFEKLKLHYYVYKSRSAVGLREQSKSVCIWSMHVLRKALYTLAERLRFEGFVPDSELVFFMTFEEIRNLIKYRDPTCLSRSFHRRRMFPQLCELKYLAMLRGPPVPIPRETTTFGTANLILKGTTISEGTITARARVILNVEEAMHIKKGEILVTYATDIGWTPFFPLLGGIVTELGGLMSHGAVVAREYGLPCVVGAHNATAIFKTGDTLLLDSTRGIVQKLADV